MQGAGQRAAPEFAGYVLIYRNHKLAVIEAKRWGLPHTEGLAQAKAYAGKLQVRFTYATNGQRVYGVDMLSGVEGEVEAYPTPEALLLSKPATSLRLARALCRCAVRGQGRVVGFALLSGQRDQQCAGSDCRQQAAHTADAGNGYRQYLDQLGEMQKIIDAENSDLFDVLAHVAFALQPISREERQGMRAARFT